MKVVVVGIIIFFVVLDYALANVSHKCDEAATRYWEEHDKEKTKEIEPEYEAQVGEIE